MGGSDAASLPCYASLNRYTDPGQVAEHVGRALHGGYRHIKLHEVEASRVEAARKAAGDAIMPRRGVIAVPQGPGLGIEPDLDVIRDYRLN